MTEIIVTLDNHADSYCLRRAIENMKGVLRTSIRTKPLEKKTRLSMSDKKWLEKLHTMRAMIPKSDMDFEDERIKYLLSK